MRFTVEVADDVLDDLRVVMEVQDPTTLGDVAFRALLRRKSLDGLIAAGGSVPDMQDIPRRRSEPA